jgi:RecJ-like exonuclease
MSELSYHDEMTHEQAEKQYREALQEKGIAICPNCWGQGSIHYLLRCFCGARVFCPKCRTMSHVEGLADEIICGFECEEKALDAAYKELTRQKDADIEAIQAKYDAAIAPINKWQAQLYLARTKRDAIAGQR